MRSKRELTAAELEEFLESRDRWIVLSTVGPDGYPHSVPMGFFRWEGDIYMGCRAPTRKTRNIEREPRVSLLLENGRGASDLIGVLITGRAELIAEPAALLEFKQALARHRGESEPTQVASGIAYIRVRPERTVSWLRA